MFHRTLPAAALIGSSLLLQACSGEPEDKLRTVKSYAYATCDSAETTDKMELDAIRIFKEDVEKTYFVREDDSLFSAHRENSSDASMLREFRGPFYLYVHPEPVDARDKEEGVQWTAMMYLHASESRTRQNGKEWSEWQPVRTRNFVDPGRTVDNMGRWKCLLGGEIAWAEVKRANDIWKTEPVVVDIYEAIDFDRLLPVPSEAERQGAASVANKVKEDSEEEGG
jgi:hypothetical protein